MNEPKASLKELAEAEARKMLAEMCRREPRERKELAGAIKDLMAGIAAFETGTAPSTFDLKAHFEAEDKRADADKAKGPKPLNDNA